MAALRSSGVSANTLLRNPETLSENGFKASRKPKFERYAPPEETGAVRLRVEDQTASEF